MASTASSQLRLELMVKGENENTWGDPKTNTNLVMLEGAMCEVKSISMSASGDTTLTVTNFTDGNYHGHVFKLSGALSGAANFVVPDYQRPYVIWNDCSGGQTMTVKTSAGSGVVIPDDYICEVFCDGTNIIQAGFMTPDTGVATPLPITQGGTGATTALGARSSLSAQAYTAGLQSISNYLLYTLPIGGLVPSNAADADHDITFTAGAATNSTASLLLRLASAMTKRFDASWVAGTGNGGDDGSGLPTSGSYHIFLIATSAGASVDILGSTSATAPSLPSGYSIFRRIFSTLTDSSANLLGFNAVEHSGGGLNVYWTASQDDYSSTGTGTSAAVLDLSVPTSILVTAIFNARATDTSGFLVVFRNAEQSDEAPAAATAIVNLTGAANAIAAAQYQIRTNASGRAVFRSSTTTLDLDVATVGFIDYRR